MAANESDYTLQTITETGTGDAINVNRKKKVTVVVSGTPSGNDIDIEYTLDNPRKSSPTWHKLATNVLGTSNPYKAEFSTPIQGVRYDCDAYNSDVTFEVLQG